MLENFTPNEIKCLSEKELETLSADVRQRIIDVVTKNGGHLASNLGAVELTVALHAVFDFPTDKLIFDVSHQCYAHKILSGRNERFDSLRTKGGISGFSDINESEFDLFSTGHAGSSLSNALGICAARDTLNQNYKVIDIIGDGSLVNGVNLEAISNTHSKPKNLIVILNDNGMSISRNKNGLYRALSKASLKSNYRKTMSFAEKLFGNSFIGKFLRKLKSGLKHSLSINSLIGLFGFKYVGIIDGNNLKELISVLSDAKDEQKALFIHIKTVKGKGFSPAEKQSTYYHGVGKDLICSENSFSSAISRLLQSRAEEHNIIAITAGMTEGTGLKDFAEKFPNRFIDVGICEENAVSLAAGIARGGAIPVVSIYSTFMQRAYDQILHDICLNNLPCVLLLDRAGVVGADGKTHQGIFDIAYLRHIPNLTILAPKNPCELEKALDYALKLKKPVSIRYPNGKVLDVSESTDSFPYWEIIKDGSDVAALSVGNRMIELVKKIALKSDKSVKIINCRTIKPLDRDTLLAIKDMKIVTFEDGIRAGGFGSAVAEFYLEQKIAANLTVYGLSDKFIEHGDVESQLKDNGLDADLINF